MHIHEAYITLILTDCRKIDLIRLVSVECMYVTRQEWIKKST